MTISKARIVRLKVNALGGESAMDMALERAGDMEFKERCPEWDEDDLPTRPDASLADDVAAGYEIAVVRRGYSTSETSGEYDADYAIVECSAPQPLFTKPDIVEDTAQYRAAVEQRALAAATPGNSLHGGRRRI